MGLECTSCFYWRPTPRMKREGFRDRALGKHELQAKIEATRLNAQWDAHRFGERNDPDVMVYPYGSLGQAYNRALALRAAERKSKGIVWTRLRIARDDWPRAWKWIGPTFSDYDPLAVVPEDLLALRAKVAERVSESEVPRHQGLAGALGQASAARLSGAARLRSVVDVRQLCPAASARGMAAA